MKKFTYFQKFEDLKKDILLILLIMIYIILQRKLFKVTPLKITDTSISTFYEQNK